ncbi:MAG: hypothetical protein COW30_02485 [Rhodospirillales bacterium CG15_BIG_FIL_POST_REV_8_21_14_020_66_15]|nr:MAG: hypothetical protein COW30_02485 [Rhodospirillales bacterium CG15_BIG_FIL_POST_REV_8_21_14_020_66_15]
MKPNQTHGPDGTAGSLQSAGVSAVLDMAFEWVYLHEKGFSDNPADPGGPTNFGVSLRHARAIGSVVNGDLLDLDLDDDGDIDADDIRLMTKEDGKRVFIHHWQTYKFDAVTHPQIAIKFVDLSYPMGYGGASRVVQRALRACRYDVIEDGFVGPNSRRVLNEAAEWNAAALMASICSEAAGYFRSLKSSDFETGWLTRAYQWP